MCICASQPSQLLALTALEEGGDYVAGLIGQLEGKGSHYVVCK